MKKKQRTSRLIEKIRRVVVLLKVIEKNSKIVYLNDGQLVEKKKEEIKNRFRSSILGEEASEAAWKQTQKKLAPMQKIIFQRAKEKAEKEIKNWPPEKKELLDLLSELSDEVSRVAFKKKDT